MNINFSSEPNVVMRDEEHLKAMWAGQSNVVVAVRVRPLMKHDALKKNCVRVLDGKVVVLMDPSQDKQDVLRVNRSREKQYAFDFAFDTSNSQEDVYSKTTKFLIHGVLDGFNATVFAYGQTGSGKTHTMIGNPDDNGIMVRVMEDLFAYSTTIGEQQRLNFKVTVSFLEVYNENIRDLLSDVTEYLDLREDPIKGPVVAGITEFEAKTGFEVMQLLHQGNARRSQAATAANEVSSRSHAVFQVLVENIDKAPGVAANIKVGKLSLVDLAGSERAANTKNTGARLVEGANINRSLLALGNCINALGEKGNKGNFVPYRDSKLTRLLKDSLGGNCRTVMIATISSAESSFEETQNTLKYANRAKNIKTNVQRNVLNVNYHISEYVQLITNLRSEIKMLKDQLMVNEGEADNMDSKLSIGVKKSVESSHLDKLANEELPSLLNSPTQHKNPITPLQMLRESMKTGDGRLIVNQMRQQIVENFQEKMQLRRSLIELEDQNVQNSIEISKRQLMVVQWCDGNGFSPSKSHIADKDSDFSEEILSLAPADIKNVWMECEQLRKAVLKNNSMKKNIAKRLRHNERESVKLREEMSSKVTGEDRRELMELQYQVGRLELDNMELEQHRIVHESILKGKDLTIQKLQLQLAVRDKVIQRQQNILSDNNLDSLVGYQQLALMEQTIMGEVDLAGTIVPPSPPRSLSAISTLVPLQIHSSIGAIASSNTVNKQIPSMRAVERTEPNAPPRKKSIDQSAENHHKHDPKPDNYKNSSSDPNDWSVDDSSAVELSVEDVVVNNDFSKSPRAVRGSNDQRRRFNGLRKKNNKLFNEGPTALPSPDINVQGNSVGIMLNRGPIGIQPGIRAGRHLRAAGEDIENSVQEQARFPFRPLQNAPKDQNGYNRGGLSVESKDTGLEKPKPSIKVLDTDSDWAPSALISPVHISSGHRFNEPSAPSNVNLADDDYEDDLFEETDDAESAVDGAHQPKHSKVRDSRNTGFSEKAAVGQTKPNQYFSSPSASLYKVSRKIVNVKSADQVAESQPVNSNPDVAQSIFGSKLMVNMKNRPLPRAARISPGNVNISGPTQFHNASNNTPQSLPFNRPRQLPIIQPRVHGADSVI